MDKSSLLMLGFYNSKLNVMD